MPPWLRIRRAALQCIQALQQREVGVGSDGEGGRVAGVYSPSRVRGASSWSCADALIAPALLGQRCCSLSVEWRRMAGWQRRDCIIMSAINGRVEIGIGDESRNAENGGELQYSLEARIGMPKQSSNRWVRSASGDSDQSRQPEPCLIRTGMECSHFTT